MKKILITGGGHAEIPLINVAKEMGYYVITTGKNRDGLGHEFADKYIFGDFSDEQCVLNLAIEEAVDGIISGCNDFAYFSTAYACEKLGLKGHDSYEVTSIIHHKNNFRKLTKELNIRTPEMYECIKREDVLLACETIGFPIVIKAIDLTGGKGIKICTKVEEALEAYDNAASMSRQNVVTAEEYIVGTNHAISVIIKNQKVVVYFCDNELYFLNKYLVSGACGPGDVPLSAISQLCGDIEKIAQHLKMVDGLFHCQFILEDGLTPVMIDPCRRAPGDLYIKLATYSTGVNYPEIIVRAELGEDFDVKMPTKFRNISRMCIMADQSGIYQGYDIDKRIKQRIIDEIVWAEDGEIIDNYMKYKAGILFFESETPDIMRELTNDFHNLVTIKSK